MENDLLAFGEEVGSYDQLGVPSSDLEKKNNNRKTRKGSHHTDFSLR